MRRVLAVGAVTVFGGWLAAGACTFDVGRFEFGVGGQGAGPGGAGGGTGGLGGSGGEGGEPIEPVTLAEGQDHPYGIVSDGSHVYWTNFGDGSSTNGSLMRVPVGGGSPEVLVPGIIAPTEVVQNDTHVFWVTFGSTGPSGGVHVLAKANGTPTELVGNYTEVYDLVLLSATDPERVYYTCGQCEAGEAGRIEWLPVGGGTPTVVASGHGDPVSITAAGASVFWVNRLGQEVFRTDTGGTVNLLTDQADAADGVATADGHLFWTASAEDRVHRMAVTGGTPTLLASGQHYGFGIAADSAHVYWVAGPSVMRMATSSTDAVAYVSGQNLPFMVALDDANLYWTDYGAGTVMMAPK